ncbi:hypothetical protein Vafri_14659, partial [Volvox africanus]
MWSIPGPVFTAGGITAHLFWSHFDTFAKPYSVWNIQDSLMSLKWPNSNMSLESQQPALVKTPTTIMGSLAVMQIVMDLSFLPGAIVVAAYSPSSTNASLTVRGVIFTSLPPAGCYPEPRSTRASPPAAIRVPPPTPPTGGAGMVMLEVPQTLPRRRLISSRRPSGGHHHEISRRMGDPNNKFRPEALLQHHQQQQVSQTQQKTTRRSITRRRREQLAVVAPPSAAAPPPPPPAVAAAAAVATLTAAAAATQGLDPALSNFTSCLWTLSFDRSAAQARHDYLLRIYDISHGQGSNVTTVMAAVPPSDTPSGSNADGDQQRPMNLPYVFLESVTLVVPQPELDVLIWSWANNSTAVATEPGLADQLDRMLTGSSLAEESAVAISSRYSYAVNASSIYDRGSDIITRLAFQRFWWCGLEGRNVVLTSVLPAEPPELIEEKIVLQPPPVRDLPVSYHSSPAAHSHDPQLPISIPSSPPQKPLQPSIATVPVHQRKMPSAVSPLSPPLTSDIITSSSPIVDDDNSQSRKTNTKTAPAAAAIIGGAVVGAFCTVAATVSGLLCCASWRRRRRRQGYSKDTAERSVPYLQNPLDKLEHAAAGDRAEQQLQQYPAAYGPDREAACNTAITSKGFTNDGSGSLPQQQLTGFHNGDSTSINISDKFQQPTSTTTSEKTAAACCTEADSTNAVAFDLPPPPPAITSTAPPPPGPSLVGANSSSSSKQVTATSALNRAYIHLLHMFYK